MQKNQFKTSIYDNFCIAKSQGHGNGKTEKCVAQ